MRPEGGIRLRGNLVETDKDLSQLLVESHILGLDLDDPRWEDGGFGAICIELDEMSVQHEPFIVGIPTEGGREDFVDNNFDSLVKLALGIPVEGVNVEFLAPGGNSNVYHFYLNNNRLAVAYIRYADVLNGIDKLESMVLLRDMGCEVNQPNFATNRSLISELVVPRRSLGDDENGRFNEIMNEHIVDLIKAKGELEERGLWRPWWRIDYKNRNNFVPIYNEEDELISVCNIDPVAVKRSEWL